MNSSAAEELLTVLSTSWQWESADTETLISWREAGNYTITDNTFYNGAYIARWNHRSDETQDAVEEFDSVAAAKVACEQHADTGKWLG